MSSALPSVASAAAANVRVALVASPGTMSGCGVTVTPCGAPATVTVSGEPNARRSTFNVTVVELVAATTASAGASDSA